MASSLKRYRAWLPLGCLSDEELERAFNGVAVLVHAHMLPRREAAQRLTVALLTVNAARADALQCQGMRGGRCAEPLWFSFCTSCPLFQRQLEDFSAAMKALTTTLAAYQVEPSKLDGVHRDHAFGHLSRDEE